MKKIISTFFAFAILCGSIYANFFSNRIFEVVLDAPINLSNNTFCIIDYLKSDVEIDLNEIAKSMPEAGFGLNLYAKPNAQINLHIDTTDVGFEFGVETTANMGLSKDLFNFICTGNEIGDEIDINGKFNADIFAYLQTTVGFGKDKLRIALCPTMFVPLVHAFSNNANVVLKNTEDGDFIYALNGQMTYYSFQPVNPESFSNIDTADSKSNIYAGTGFDLSGTVDWKILKTVTLSTNFRIPIVPGRFPYENVRSFGMYMKTNLNSIMNGEMTEEFQEFELEGGEWVPTDYFINRPFKCDFLVSFKPFGNFYTLLLGGGVGVRYPFSPVPEEIAVYPEYYFGSSINVFDVFRFGFTSEYAEQIFKHQLAATFNVRLLQLDLGVSSQSSNFGASLKFAGLGAFVTVTVGF